MVKFSQHDPIMNLKTTITLQLVFLHINYLIEAYDLNISSF